MIKLARKLEIAQAGNTGQLENCKLQAGSGELETAGQELELAGQLEIIGQAGNISCKLEMS